MEYFLIQQFTKKWLRKWLRKSVYNDKDTFNTFETIVDINMNDATQTCATWRTEHTYTLSFVALSHHSSHHMAQGRLALVFPWSSHPWTCAVVFECSSPSPSTSCCSSSSSLS